jgi:hypothetical protein
MRMSKPLNVPVGLQTSSAYLPSYSYIVKAQAKASAQSCRGEGPKGKELVSRANNWPHRSEWSKCGSAQPHASFDDNMK